MIGYEYSYLIGTLIILGIWIGLFLYRKDTRREMVVISMLFLLTGFMEGVYVLDWYNPSTFTNSIPGIESFLLAFTYPGIVAVAYEILFKKKIREKKHKKKSTFEPLKLILLLGVVLGLILLGVFGFGLNSFLSTVISICIGIFFIWYMRPDLIIDSLISGILALLIVIPVFTIVEQITPGVVQHVWLFQNVPNIVILSVPIDDIIFYLVSGMFIGPLYEFWQEARLVDVKKRKNET